MLKQKSPNHQSNARTTQIAPPAHMQAPHEPKHTPPKPMQQCNMGMQQREKHCSLCLARLDRLHRAVRPPIGHLTAWGRFDRPMRPDLHQTFQKLPYELEHLPNVPRFPNHAQTSPRC
jgi:muconolactone delta-isomerase